MTREELERGRHRGYRIYGYFWSFCEQNRCCEDCDKWIRFGCKLKRKIESIQKKRILRICKPEPYKGGTMSLHYKANEMYRTVGGEMINLQMFNTEEDLMKLTGLTRDELWDNDFDLDDWDVGFVSDVPLTKTKTYEYGEHGEEFDEYEEPVEDAYWLVHRMEEYCVGYRHVEFKGRHYYMVYHA